MSTTATAAARAHPDDTTLWYTRCPLPSASAVAIDHGFLRRRFEGTGMQVRSVQSTPDERVRRSHFDHEVRHLFRQGGNIPPLWSRSRGADSCVVGIATTREYQAIIARPGNRIREPADLRGARLALPRRRNEPIDYWRAMCLRGYESALHAAGLTLADVQLVELDVEESYIDAPDTRSSDMPLWGPASRARRQRAEVFAFVRCDIDALYTSGALGLQTKALLGAHEVVEFGLHGAAAVGTNNQVPNVLTVDRALAREHPDVVARYIAALHDAAQWSLHHPDDALRSFAREIGTAEEWLPAAYGDGLMRSLPVTLEADAVALVADQARFLRRHGFIASDVAIEPWIDREPLQLAQQEMQRQ